MGMAMRKRDGRGPAEINPRSAQGSDDLVFYLVVRFIAVLVVVMVAESVIVWFVSIALPPALHGLLGEIEGVSSQQTTSLVALLRWVFLLVGALTRANYLQVAGLARSSASVLLILIMLLLLASPLLAGALVLARSVVNRVRILQAERERELMQIDQQRNQFMTDVAHDLRTPLMAISGMAHAISDGVVRGEAMRDEYLQSICDKADKMSELINSVFDYTKLGSGSFELERGELDLPQLLLREAAVAYADIEDAGMHFSVVVPEERCIIYADQTQLARVVANLLTNAVRHNDPGTEIALLLVRRAGVAYVVVADTGDPISQDPDDLFQPFSRGDASRSAAGGSGLGLSICKRIAQMHDYELSLVQPYGRFGKAFVLVCNVVG